MKFKPLWSCAINSTAAVRPLTSRYLVPSLLITGFLNILVALPVARSQDLRHHGTHEHGVAQINVAVEGDTVYIEFSSPAANIVGFEHSPSTREQKESVKESIKLLKTGEILFQLSPEARGKLTESMAETDIGEEHHDATEHEHERHSEFEAEYRFVCEKPEKLAHIDVVLFRFFSGIERIEVQILTGTKQTAQKLTAKENKIIF